MNTTDDYLWVDAKIVAKTSKAVLLKNASGEGWVPRSCIHGADDAKVEDGEREDAIRIRVREWKVDELGL